MGRFGSQLWTSREEAHGGCEFDSILIKYKKDYDAALPDDLPVIPKSWADTIEEYKANHYRLGKIFTDALILNYDEQELIARAWLDGYVVEVDK